LREEESIERRNEINEIIFVKNEEGIKEKNLEGFDQEEPQE